MESIALLVLLLGILTVLGIPKLKRTTPLPVTHATNIEPYGDTYAQYYDVLSYDPDRRAFQEALVDRFINAESDTLEVGCGLGHLVQRTGGTGLDKSAAMVQAAAERYPKKATFVVGDAQNAHLFPAERFTHMFCFGPTLLLMERKDLFFHSAKKWLEPGGTLCVTVQFKPAERSLVPSNLHYRASWTDKTHWVETFQHNGAKFKAKHAFFHETEETVCSLAKRAGFVLQEIVAFKQERVAIFKAGI